MSKYDSLGNFLKSQATDRVPMSFAEIERITGVRLPASARRYRPWWSNNATNSVMTKVWLDAGFESEQVDMAGGRLVFRRIRAPRQGGALKGQASGKFHPLAGLLRDVTTVMPGADLTEPADPEWAQRQ